MKSLFKILFILFTVFQCNIAFGNAETGKDKEKKTEKKESISIEKKLGIPQSRQFPSLELGDDFNSQIIEPDILRANELVEEVSVQIEYYRKRAEELNLFVEQKERFTEFLDEKTLLDLPIGIKKTIGNLVYTIVIDSLVMTPVDAYLIAYMSFEIPSDTTKIAFRGDKIKLSKKGGITGEAKLNLLGDYPIKLFGENSALVLKGDQTFVEFDCDGFKEMGLGADVFFSRDLIVPENSDGGIIKDERVSANFSTILTDWNDMVVEVSLPDFQVANVEGVGFSVKNAVFDFSDFRNAPSVNFPQGYESTQMLPGNPNLWRGFYLRELEVRLPPQFKKKSGGRTTIGVYDMIIDNMGFTGTIAGENLIETDNGDMDGWAFSLDRLEVAIQANQLKSAEFNGEIIVPIADDQTPFEYTGIIASKNEYIFNVSAAEDIQFELFKTSKVEIYEASYLEIKVADGKFIPKANLHGKMSINAKLGDSSSSKSASIADITFEALELQSVKPYVKIGAFSFGSERAQQAMADLPISINNIGMRSLSDTQVGLDFDIEVNLTEEFGGAAGLTIVGNIDSEKGYQSWRFKRIDVNKIMIDIDQGAFKFYGQILFFRNDVVYGNGFNGIIDAEFSPGIKLKCTAIFGSVDEFRYWYADAMVEFNSGIPIFSGVGIYGFGGGAYYGMKMDTEGIGSEFGKTASGVVYVPESTAGLGLKATVAIGSHPSNTAFNGDATFEISFFKGGGVRYIAFSGNAYIMTPPMGDQLAGLQDKVGKVADAASKVGDAGGGMLGGALNGGTDNSATEIYGDIGEAAGEKGSISAHMMVSYDFENRVLHGNFEMFVNVAGGIIKGVGPGGRAGWAVMHFAPGEWYIYIGTPDDRCGLSAGVGPISAELTSYFMVGTKILNSPPPPDIVSEILGGVDLDYMGDLNSLGEGKGFAFGSALSIDTGDLTFLMFYSRFQAGLGFDIMLKNYGNNVRCKGRDDPLGVNGWYANGQMYAYFDGKIGIRVKLFGKNKNVEILQMGAAAVLQAKLPNPFWMRGIVGGYYNVLGGLVKGQCKFEVVLGEECEMINGSALDGIEVIADATPQKGEKEVDVFNTPQAVFNMPIMKNFTLVDVDDVKKTFRIKLDYFKLMNGSSTIQGELEWNADKTVAAFNSHDVFPSEKKIDLKIKVSFQELVNGAWQQVVVDGKTYTEEWNSTFTSGVAPDYIPHGNVTYSYPVINQYNYYPMEATTGYIKLNKGQSYLFDVDAEWKQVARFTTKDGSKKQFSFNYNAEAKEVTCTLPTDIKTNTIYAFELINTPAQATGKVDRNVSNKTNKIAIGDESMNVEITTKKAEGMIKELQEKAVYTAYLRTSKYKTFVEKMNNLPVLNHYRLNIFGAVHAIGINFTGEELFDGYEILGKGKAFPLIQYEASLRDNDWYNNEIYPLVYHQYPIDGDIKITNRDITELGLPPTKNVYILQNPNNVVLDNFHFESISFPAYSILRYNLAHCMYYDYKDLENQLANRYVGNGGNVSQRVAYILTNKFPRIKKGKYNVIAKYSLPGKNIISSRTSLIINNPLD